MPKGRLGPLGVLLALALSFGTPSSALANTVVSAADVGQAIVFRETAGFRSDEDFVRGTFADHSTFPDLQYGVPLSEAEAAEIGRRIAIQLAVDPVIEYASHLDGYAGVYMDQQRGGMPVFMVAGQDRQAWVADLAERMPPGVDYDLVEVGHARAELEQLKHTIWGERGELARAGIDIQSAGLDIRNNQVLVGVNGLTEVADTELQSRYGPVGTVEEEIDAHLDACLSRIDCWPMKGGIKIYEQVNTSSICTSGFVVRRQGTSTYRMLTAGHCLALATGGLNSMWRHSGTDIGTGRTETYGNLSNADAGLIAMSAPSGPDNLLFGVSENDIRTVGGYVTTSSQNVGDYLCRSGRTTGFWCGNLTLEDRVKDVDGTAIEHQWVDNFDASPGDSGAPYFTTSGGVTLAWGIHSDSTSANPPGGSAWYSPMGWVFSKLSSYGEPITLCTDSTCGL